MFLETIDAIRREVIRSKFLTKTLYQKEIQEKSQNLNLAMSCMPHLMAQSSKQNYRIYLPDDGTAPLGGVGLPSLVVKQNGKVMRGEKRVKQSIPNKILL